MKIRELIELLQEAARDCDQGEEAEVRIPRSCTHIGDTSLFTVDNDGCEIFLTEE